MRLVTWSANVSITVYSCLPAGRRRSRGFTLLEVMVALTVVALGMLAAFGTINQSTLNAVRLQDRTLANWIAMNRLTEMRVANSFPDTGSSDGDVEMAGLQWRWIADVSETQVEGLRRVDVSVSYADTPDEIVITVSGFLGRPVPDGVRGTPWTGTPAEAPDGDDERPDDPRLPREPGSDR